MGNENLTEKTYGRLTIIPTPIGNLEDITLRAIRCIRESDLLLCEDTRTTGRLLALLQIERRTLLSLHARNETSRISEVLATLETGRQVGLVSDAGTPGMSDPGLSLIGAVISAGHELDVLPGPTAFVPALLLSGLPVLPFHFEGFLPQKKGRIRRIERLAELPQTVVLYESPHRIVRLLSELSAAAGEERPAAVLREISKLHQEALRGSLGELHTLLSDRPRVRGEIVAVMQGKD